MVKVESLRGIAQACTKLEGLITPFVVFRTVLGLQKENILSLWFPSPPLAVSNGKSTTQRLSMFVGHALGVRTPACVESLTNYSVPRGCHPVTGWIHVARNYLQYIQ